MVSMDPEGWMRDGLLAASRSGQLRGIIEKAPVTKQVVNRYVPAVSEGDAVTATRDLIDRGRLVTIDFLGEDTSDLAQAAATRDAYITLLTALSEAGLTSGGRAEVSVKLSAVGQFLGADGEKVALDNARQICRAAANAGTTVTLDMEDHTTTDSTLSILRELRQDFPTTGAVLQAYLLRTEADCRDLAHAGSRVRLCKGAYKEPASVAFQKDEEVDLSYVRCLKVLMNGEGYPMVASHDPNIIEIADHLADTLGRANDTWEHQMLYGIRPHEEDRLIGQGRQMRVYLPFGDEWYGYFMRRLAERPANVAFFLRSLVSRG